MRIEIDNVVVVVEWVPFLRATESAPAEGGDFEVVEISGFHHADEVDSIEERAIAAAWDRMEENGYL